MEAEPSRDVEQCTERFAADVREFLVQEVKELTNIFGAIFRKME